MRMLYQQVQILTFRGARTNFSMGSTPVDRRLHQLMLADVEIDTDATVGPSEAVGLKPIVTIERCEEKAYSVVNVKCKDRPKLLFDIVCTLTDMQFVVFHASVTSDGLYGLQVGLERISNIIVLVMLIIHVILFL